MRDYFNLNSATRLDFNQSPMRAGNSKPIGFEGFPLSQGNIVKPPIVLRGLDSQYVHNDQIVADDALDWGCLRVDWLSLTFNDVDSVEIFEILVDFFGDYTKSSSKGFYNSSLIFNQHNIIVSFNDYNLDFIESMQGRFSVSFSGSAIGFLGSINFMSIITCLMKFSPKCTRMDYAFDDYTREIEVEDLASICNKGDLSGFHKVNYLCPHNKGVVTGKQVSLGNRGSSGNGKYMRIYDKFLESKGEFDCIRYEVEFSKKYADLAFSQVVFLSALNDVKQLSSHIGEYIGSVVDFIEREQGVKNLDRLNRYDFWTKIIDLIGKAKLNFTCKVDNKLEIMSYYRKSQYNAILVTEFLALGKERFLKMLYDDLCDGLHRIKPKHRISLSRARNLAGLKSIDNNLEESFKSFLNDDKSFNNLLLDLDVI